MRYTILKTEYDEWISGETWKDKFQVAKRLEKIESHGHFGGVREELGGRENELKWGTRRRVYYAHIPETTILLLLGGNKNEQDYDIAQAKKILKEHVENEA